MDSNKMQAFADNEVVITATCATCKHSSFPTPQASWGECGLWTYEHAKHGKRQLPAHVAFVCPEWAADTALESKRELGDYAEHMQRGLSPCRQK